MLSAMKGSPVVLVRRVKPTRMGSVLMFSDRESRARVKRFFFPADYRAKERLLAV